MPKEREEKMPYWFEFTLLGPSLNCYTVALYFQSLYEHQIAHRKLETFSYLLFVVTKETFSVVLSANFP